MGQQLYMLNCNTNLKQLVIPLSPVEYEKLEEQIKCHGGAKGVKVWDKTILVDYEYYDYCQSYNIPFCLIEVPLRNEAEAVVWVCRHQLQRKFLPQEMRKYLIGKQSLAERENNLQQLKTLGTSAGQHALSLTKLAYYNSLKTVVGERIGKEYNLTYTTVSRYANYAKALDYMRNICLRFVNEHLEGRLRISVENILSLAALPAERMYNECQRRLHEPVEVGLGQKSGTATKKTPEYKQKAMPVLSIKDMPVYDPDAEIISLVFTIPSWRSSISRVKDVVVVEKASREARLRLIEALLLLESTADKLIDYLKEEPNEEF